jgi:Na+/proline symporter
MSQALILSIILLYFGVLLLVSYYTSRKADNQTFFAANKSASWYLVAFGMVGTSLSGVTFISVPGTVGAVGFTYFQVVLGYFLGYFAVAFILLPLYYKMQLTSIYSYLQERMGMISYKTGASFFIL